MFSEVKTHSEIQQRGKRPGKIFARALPQIHSAEHRGHKKGQEIVETVLEV
jgi:hypothetical protein